MHLFCFGYGYSAQALADQLSARAMTIAGTQTRVEAGPGRRGQKLVEFRGDKPSEEVRALLKQATHVLVSIPPDLEGDIVLRHCRGDLAANAGLAWIGYLSTVGVYGDWQGDWVDESTRPRPVSERSLLRLRAERDWIDFAQETGRRVQIFRLAGIYGPGRSVVDGLRAGTARRIIKPGQVFNRIHVEDIARVLAAAIDRQGRHRIYNVSDDEPAPPQDVVAYAAGLLGIAPPPEVSFADAGLRGMAASFWSECKRVRNERIKQDLGVSLLYPTYREGLRALAAS